jgi:hypothetical protein
MLVMATLAACLAVIVPDQIFNLFIAMFTVYLVTTAWMTVRRQERTIGLPEKIAAGLIGLLDDPHPIYELVQGRSSYCAEPVMFHICADVDLSGFMPARLRRSGIHCRCRVVELSGLQRPGDLVRTEDDAGRHCFRADELE